MGNHVVLLRKKNGEFIGITKRDIERLVTSQPELSIASPSLESADLDLCVPIVGNLASRLTLQNGVLWAKDPDERTIAVLIHIAKELNARVRNDQFETYKSPVETYIDPDDSAEIAEADKRGRDSIVRFTRQQSKIRNIVILMLFILFIFIFIAGNLLPIR